MPAATDEDDSATTLHQRYLVAWIRGGEGQSTRSLVLAGGTTGRGRRYLPLNYWEENAGDGADEVHSRPKKRTASHHGLVATATQHKSTSRAVLPAAIVYLKEIAGDL